MIRGMSMERINLKKCALCDRETDLQLSHIIPKFVGRHLKKTSIGNIRNLEDYNNIIQDIEKHYMLCHDCEELFSASERWFANNVFYPWQKDKKDEIQYNKHLHYFITSLSWRSLYLDILFHVKNNDIDILSLNKMIESEKIMKEYLLNNREDTGLIENHIFFFDRVEEVVSKNDKTFYLSPHVTVHRSITSYSVTSGDTIFTVSNLMGIIVVTLYYKGICEKWSGTKIKCGSGLLSAKNQIMKSVVGGEISYWLQEAEKKSKNLNSEQKKKIIDKINAVKKSIKDYQIYDDINYDIRLRKHNLLD